MTIHEKKVQSDILKYLKELENNNIPIIFERRQAGGFSYKKGQADVYFVINGKHIEVECKSEDGKQRVMQEKWQAKCERANIPYWLINDFEEFKTLIDKYLP